MGKELFPAHAGVIPAAKISTSDTATFPRIRGGDPESKTYTFEKTVLFPAYAGVILPDRNLLFGRCSFPRIRGGDPISLDFCASLVDFSPHTRG